MRTSTTGCPSRDIEISGAGSVADLEELERIAAMMRHPSAGGSGGPPGSPPGSSVGGFGPSDEQPGRVSLPSDGVIAWVARLQCGHDTGGKALEVPTVGIPWLCKVCDERTFVVDVVDSRPQRDANGRV